MVLQIVLGINIMEKYYRRIRDLREDHDMTQLQVARYLKTELRQYRRYELGEVAIPVYFLIHLARLYDTSADYILELTDDPKPYKRV